jgi:hypothetical protein
MSDVKKISLADDISVDTVLDDAPTDEVLAVNPTEPVLLTPDTVNDFAVQLVRGYVPFDDGDAHFSEVCKDWKGGGTTCGFLPHWLIWRLGVRDPKLVNRSEITDGLHYMDGMNISKIWNGGQSPFVPRRADAVPEPGDICFISNGPPITEHVFVFLSEVATSGTTTFEVGEAGQVNQAGKQCARIHNPSFHNGQVGTRNLVGWISLKKLTFAATALLVGPDGTPLAQK